MTVQDEAYTHPYMRTDSKMSSQSLITPATFMVKALVLPISRNTAIFRAAYAAGNVGLEARLCGWGLAGVCSSRCLIPCLILLREPEKRLPEWVCTAKITLHPMTHVS